MIEHILKGKWHEQVEFELSKIIKMGALGWHSYKAQKQMISELSANKVTKAEKLQEEFMKWKLKKEDPG